MDTLETFGEGFAFSTRAKTWVQRRLITVDTHGRRTSSVEIPEAVEVGAGRDIMRFPVPARRIREIRLETRPYAWAEFRDVALQPQSGPEGAKS